MDEIASRFSESITHLGQAGFYPLVASLFVAAGIPVWRPAGGDTSNRIDLVLVDEEESIPVEVKSPTESAAINVKSIQQALENRVVLDQRGFFQSKRETSSLAIALLYPPLRSDAIELVEDIAEAFGINIGLVNLSSLYEMMLSNVRQADLRVIDSLKRLRGPFK